MAPPTVTSSVVATVGDARVKRKARIGTIGQRKRRAATPKRVQPVSIDHDAGKEKKGAFAMKTLSTTVFASSAAPSIVTASGAIFTISMARAPLNIPSHATNVVASLIQAFIPASVDSSPLFIETNFTEGGVNLQGDRSQILAMIIPPDDVDTAIIEHPNTPVRIPCTAAVKGTNPLQLEFRLLDKDRVSVPVDGVWYVQILFEWEQEQELSELRSSMLETQYY